MTNQEDIKIEKEKEDNTTNKDFQIGDHVIVQSRSGEQSGVLRFIGRTKFKSGIWFGIELYQPKGRYDGSVRGVRYFDCPPLHGVFFPPHKVMIDDSISFVTCEASESEDDSDDLPSELLKYRKEDTPLIDISQLSAKLTVGSFVIVETKSAGLQTGILRFIGQTKFKAGIWMGVELDSKNGINDGSVKGVYYFNCAVDYGLFVKPDKVQLDPESPIISDKLVIHCRSYDKKIVVDCKLEVGISGPTGTFPVVISTNVDGSYNVNYKWSKHKPLRGGNYFITAVADENPIVGFPQTIPLYSDKEIAKQERKKKKEISEQEKFYPKSILNMYKRKI